MQGDNQKPKSFLTRKFVPNISSSLGQQSQQPVEEAKTKPLQNAKKDKFKAKGHKKGKDKKHEIITTQGPFSSGIFIKPSDKSTLQQPRSKKLNPMTRDHSINTNEPIANESLLNMDSKENAKFVELDAPITLPLSLRLNSLINTDGQQNTQSYSDIKNENDNTSFKNNSDLANFFLQNKMASKELLLIQLPTILPLVNEKTFNEVMKSTSTIDVSKNLTNFNHSLPSAESRTQTLKNASEGHLGRLRLHRSGKMTLQIGNHSFIVNEGCKNSFLQQIYCMYPDGSGSTYLECIGKVANKMIVIPNF